MKVKIDENIPATVISYFTEEGHEADTVQQEGLKGCSDPDVWDAAQREERLLITQDLDFSDIRRYTPGTHHGLLLIRLHEPGRLAVRDYLAGLLQQHDLSDWVGCNVVATEHKIRIRRPDAKSGSKNDSDLKND